MLLASRKLSFIHWKALQLSLNSNWNIKFSCIKVMTLKWPAWDLQSIKWARKGLKWKRRNVLTGSSHINDIILVTKEIFHVSKRQAKNFHATRSHFGLFLLRTERQSKIKRAYGTLVIMQQLARAFISMSHIQGSQNKDN